MLFIRNKDIPIKSRNNTHDTLNNEMKYAPIIMIVGMNPILRIMSRVLIILEINTDIGWGNVLPMILKNTPGGTSRTTVRIYVPNNAKIMKYKMMVFSYGMPTSSSIDSITERVV